MSTTHNVTDEQIEQCMEDIAEGRTRAMLTDVMKWIHSNLSPEDLWDTDYLLEVILATHKEKLCRLIEAECSVGEVFQSSAIRQWINNE